MSSSLDKNEISKKFFETIPRLMHLLRIETRKAASPGLSIPQLRVLAHINRGLVHVGELAEHQGVSQPAMSKLIDGLVCRKLVKRTPNDSDRRVVELSLTAKGSELFHTVKNHASKEFEEKLNVLSDKKIKELSESLDSFLNILEHFDSRGGHLE